jgi:LasA protease
MQSRRILLLIFAGITIMALVMVFALMQLTRIDEDEFSQPGVLPTLPPQVAGEEKDPLDNDQRWLMPDSELINSPTAVGFDVATFLASSYLASFQQEYQKETFSGVEMVERTAIGHSIHPKLLLTLIEYQSGWVSAQNETQLKHVSGIGLENSPHEGFYQELYWAADKLAYGYYARRVGALNAVGLRDGGMVNLPEELNAGSAAVYYFFSLVCDTPCWSEAIENNGFVNTYAAMFGDPDDVAIEPLLPPVLQQPAMQLPFETGVTWSFTGGPHPAWGAGSAWAGLDFAPPKEVLGCVPSDEWIVAVADGVIVRSEPGLVMQDLDGDGFEQTGWAVLYYHVATENRIVAGTKVNAGDRIGHPSCEGGFSTGTHLHIARKYNGEWIPADQDIPFNLDGWISSGTGSSYNGLLQKNGQIVEAVDRPDEKNQIGR